jgi:hypothetical protein
VEPASVRAPLVVYSDAGSDFNRFEPCGWMGDIHSLALDTACGSDPRSGKTCIRAAYDPAIFHDKGWAGIYWQHPQHDVGEYPGYNLTGAAKLTFWARGEKGGERCELRAGMPHRDSFGARSTGVIMLTEEWKKYTLDLKGEDVSSIIGGSCWIVERSLNPDGCVIYFDDISFEP